MLDKTYRPETVETRQYEAWEAAGAFAADPTGSKRPYTIMLPPPNVTGSLHMGHALSYTLQDVLIRFERMRGRDALWQPGTDHAGIATEIVVSNQLAERQIGRHDLGRAKFIERVWEWKAESGGTITRQLRRLGASLDWSRDRFTMEPGLSAAVRRVFVTLYREGLIYRDKRLVNWDPVMHTVISDLEVDNRETRGSLWHIRYPIEGEAGRFVVVATTRPETMLGDTGVAVHPDDTRRAGLVGKTVRLPLVGRLIPIVADEHADPEKGSGAVKITPAHDFNDFEVGRRRGLPAVNIFDRDAHLNDAVPEKYRGLERFAARKQVLADLEAAGLIEKVEDHVLMVPHHDRSGEIIEPWLTDQWFCNAAELAGPAIEAVERGRTQFVPRQWENTFFEWMRNIQPWCISRQLWWGHQIPAWYGPDGHVFVAESADEAAREAAAHYGRAANLEQDEDVLDTWFSSGLWPFSTLGWPEETAELKRYYPGDVLVTGFDIIFFWVARMMMQGLHFMGDVPFRTVYIHALVRDERGQKMSKSRGNIIDPLDLIDRYGCDALRFTLAALASPGRDIKLPESRVESSRNFTTKLWNAARYAEMSGCALQPGFDPRSCRLTVNRWIAGATRDCAVAVTTALETFRFDEAAHRLYHFAWGTFCDWYLEFTKPILAGDDAAARIETQATTAWVLAQTLHLLHPVMPFITEELWRQLAGEEAGMLIRATWPDLPPELHDPEAASEMDWVVAAITAIRAIRTEVNVPAAARLPLLVKHPDAAAAEHLKRLQEQVQRSLREVEPAAAEQIKRLQEQVQLSVKEVDPAAAEQLKRFQEQIQRSLSEVDPATEQLKRFQEQIQRSLREVDPAAAEHLKRFQEQIQRSLREVEPAAAEQIKRLQEQIQRSLREVDPAAAEQIKHFQEQIQRSLREVEPAAEQLKRFQDQIQRSLREVEPAAAEQIKHFQEQIQRLARVEHIQAVDNIPAGGVAAVVDGTTLILRVGDVIDLGKEKARLAKEIGRLDADLKKSAQKLANPAFLAKAKPEIIEEQREREADARRDRDRLQAVYDRIASG